MTGQQEALAQMMDSAEYVPPESTRNFHISLEGEYGSEQIQKALATAGIKASATPTTQEQNGIFLTHRMASFTWDSQTGNSNCNGSCTKSGRPPHRNYHDLSPEQQARFTDHVIQIMHLARGDTDLNLAEISRLDPQVCTEECN